MVHSWGYPCDNESILNLQYKKSGCRSGVSQFPFSVGRIESPQIEHKPWVVMGVVKGTAHAPASDMARFRENRYP